MIFIGFLMFCMVAVIWLDITRYLIPNWLVGLMLAAYPVAVVLSPMEIDWKMAIAGMSAIFVVGYAVFSMRWMGGGDIKLLTVCALWVGLKSLADYLFLVAILGGVFSVLLFGFRKFEPVLQEKFCKSKPLPRVLRHGEPMPYGVAIALGFLLMLWNGKIPGLI